MKKPITIGVIAVIVTILVTSAVDYSAIGAKPLDQIHIETASSEAVGIISCPNGDTVVTETISIYFTEHDIHNTRGSFVQYHTPSGESQQSVSATFWGGSVQSDNFTLTGIGSASFGLADFCEENFPENNIVTVWGKCGQDVTVHFESELGYSGSFTGNVLCV
jgi:hypothetical protein